MRYMADKLEKGFSIHGDPYMVWKDNRICSRCLNRMPLQGTECDVFDDVEDVNEAIHSGECEFYLEREDV